MLNAEDGNFNKFLVINTKFLQRLSMTDQLSLHRMDIGVRNMNREELLKIAKPILFNQSMVQAILDGRKTATRRAIKGLPVDAKFAGWLLDSTMQEDVKDIGKAGFRTNKPTKKAGCVFVKPPYKVGDILYVRETWGIGGFNCDSNEMFVEYRADGKTSKILLSEEKFRKYYDSISGSEPDFRPSIFMPKEAARIFLKVMDVRVERLQNINGCGLEKEGIKTGITHFKSMFNNFGNAEHYKVAQEKFSSIWDSTVKKKDIKNYGWKTNPWVWVIEFERVI